MMPAAPDPTPTTPPTPARLAALGLAIVAMTLAVGYGPSLDPDLWWHLRTGQLALARRSLLPVDPFSYSFAGAPWRYKDLVADVLLYAGYAGLGFASFVVLKVAAVAAWAACLWRAMRRPERSPAVMLLGLGLLLATVPVAERPNLFSVVAFVALLALLERARARLEERGARAALRAFAPVVALAWAWGCLHRAATLAPVVALGFAVVVTLGAWLWRWPRLRAVAGPRASLAMLVACWVTPLAAAAALCLNPSGAALLRTSVAVTSSAMFRAAISNWRRVGVEELWRAFPLSLVLSIAAGVAVVAVLVRAVRRGAAAAPVDLWHAVLLGGGGLAARDSVRWVPFLVMAAVVVAVRLLGAADARLWRHRPRPRGLALLVGVAAVAALLAWRTEPFKLGVPERIYPEGAVVFAKTNGLRGKTVAAFEVSGYVIWRSWPEARVLVDGRNDILYPPDFVLRCLRAEHDATEFAAMRREDGASWVIASNRVGSMTHVFLAHDPDWALVYWSEAATVYVRRDRHPELAAMAFADMDPAAVDVSVVRAFRASRGDPARLQRLADEVERMRAASPDSVRANVAVALYCHLMGPEWRARRDAALAHLEVIAPGDPAVVELRRRLEAPRP